LGFDGRSADWAYVLLGRKGGHVTDDALGKRPRQEEVERQGGFARRFLTARVPVWLSLGLVVVIVATAAVLLVVQAGSAVRLGPAVGASQSIDVRMTLCNRDVDRLEINPREAELDLEKVLREQGSKQANVVVVREDCPTTASSAP
jgi:hypothetical protein